MADQEQPGQEPIDESGALDDVGVTSGDVRPVDEADLEVPPAFEDRQDVTGTSPPE